MFKRQFYTSKSLFTSFVQNKIRAINLDAIVHSYYQQAAAAVYQAIGNAAKFFKSALLYLAYTPISQIPESQRPQLNKIQKTIIHKISDFQN